jgi:feruloyl esterase
MHSQFFRRLVWPVFVLAACASAQQIDSCAGLMKFKSLSVEITKAAPIAAGTAEPNPYGPGNSAPLPAYCRVEGVINRRTGVGGEGFGIDFALAMPDKWNGDFLMQGGGGGEWNCASAAWPFCLWRYTGAHAGIRCGQHRYRP